VQGATSEAAREVARAAGFRQTHLLVRVADQQHVQLVEVLGRGVARRRGRQARALAAQQHARAARRLERLLRALHTHAG